MERFCGLLWNRNQPVDIRKVKLMLDRQYFDQASDQYIFSHQRFSFGISYRMESLPVIIQTDRYLFYVCGRIDNIDFRQFSNKKHSFLNDFFSKRLESRLGSIRGDFILVLYDKLLQNLNCVRDQIGVQPFFYTKNEQCFSFSNDLGTFKNVPGFSLQMDDQWIADSISLTKSAKNHSPYVGIQKLMPGNLITINDVTETKRYWAISSSEDYSGLDFNNATELFSEKFNEAVRKRLKDCNVVGTELSGGLDSSGVTAYTLKNRIAAEQSFCSLSHVLFEEDRHGELPFQDESSYSKTFAKTLNIENHFLCSGKDSGILKSIKHSIRNQSGPSQANFHIFSDILLKEAKQFGVKRLFFWVWW